jgi:hypothetical protein
MQKNCELGMSFMSLSRPLLAEVSEPSRRVAPLPDLDVGRDGLLRRKGSKTPLVEELLSSLAECAVGAIPALETILTRVYPDNPDPLVRDPRRLDAAEKGLWLSTIMTKGDDRPDPYFLHTIMTEQRYDQPDPNRARRGR